MTASTESATPKPPLWQLVALSEYCLPESPVVQAADTGLALYKRWFHRKQTVPNASLKNELEITALDDWQLEQVAPAPKPDLAVAAVNLTLHDWLADEQPAEAIIVLLAPPHSGYADIIKIWAQQQAWRQLKLPSVEQINDNHSSWLDMQMSSSGPWVLANLEQCFLRHATGMNLLRSFLNTATSGSLGKGVIVCDSWAWAFIQHIWPGRLPVTLTFQAFDQKRLMQLLAQPNTQKQFSVRQSVTGDYIFPAESSEKELKRSPFLQYLAMYARGNPGIARSIWRNNLEVEVGLPSIQSPKINQQTLWILPWQKIPHPDIHGYTTRDEAFILHALLIHNGLSAKLLPQVTPLVDYQVLAKLSCLKTANLVTEKSGRWLVSAQGYLVVREFLLDSGYLVDQF